MMIIKIISFPFWFWVVEFFGVFCPFFFGVFCCCFGGVLVGLGFGFFSLFWGFFVGFLQATSSLIPLCPTTMLQSHLLLLVIIKFDTAIKNIVFQKTMFLSTSISHF